MDLNKPETWLINIAAPWSPSEHQAFQKQLNQIAGTEDDGTYRLRLVWGQDFEKTLRWNRIKHRWQPKYIKREYGVATWDADVGLYKHETRFTGVPRYYLEGLIPVAARDPKEETASFETVTERDERGVPHEQKQLVSEQKIALLYATVKTINAHSDFRTPDGERQCCVQRREEGMKCYGTFRYPNASDLQILRRKWHEHLELGVDHRVLLTDSDKRKLHFHAMMTAQAETDAVQRQINDLKREGAKLMMQGISPGVKNRFSIPKV